jgi:deoxyhypusine synthase
VRRPEFNDGVEFHSLMAAMATMGFQGTHMAQAVDEINKMVRAGSVGQYGRIAVGASCAPAAAARH